MCNEEAKKLYTLPTWTLQSGPSKSWKVDYMDDPDEAPVFNFDVEIDIPPACIRIVGRCSVGV